jgi:hypothetical protein
MPIKPQSMKLICRTCGASRIFSPARLQQEDKIHARLN